MPKECDVEEVRLDFTPMIDVVFLLIIFFILMPPKEMEGQLQSWLPREGGSSASPDPLDQPFNLSLRSRANNEDIETEVFFNMKLVGVVRTLSLEALDKIYSDDKASKKQRLSQEYARDERELSPISPGTMQNLVKKMKLAAESAKEGVNTKVIIDVQPNVPFKVVLAVLNAGGGAQFSKLNFTAPPNSIWAQN
ncbi:MAG: biopolymer transporter ExbD [Planctomycetes bacterium]|nr:biopolymer transporter ExbD [Planctomycetota bacterium]